jgi:hypothetical protein
MECLYCGGFNFKQLHEHPYPYFRKVSDKVTQEIFKYQCSCGYPFFVEVKTGLPTQFYKQGMYQYHG